MGMLSNLIQYRSNTLKNPSGWLRDALSGAKSATGVSVNENTALSLSAVYASVRLISETVASLPLSVYEKTDKGKQKAVNHPLYEVLHYQVNNEMTSFSWRKTSFVHLLMRGNAYSEIEYDNAGQVRGLWLLPPDRVSKFRKPNGNIAYKISLPNGGDVELPDWKVLHLFGISKDGLTGMSPLQLAKEMFGLGIALEQHAAYFFGNGARPGGFIETQHSLSDKARERLKQDFEKLHQGLSNSHRIALLEEGMSYKQLQLPNDQMQFIESRKFSVEEIARFFNVPPHMIQSLDRATFSNIEHQAIQYVVHSIRPWLVNFEQELRRSLFTEVEKKKYFAEFNVEGLLRGDSQSRSEYYNKMFQIGAYTINDIRELENMNTIGEEGNIHYVPLNMVPTNQLSELNKESVQTDKRNLEKRYIEQRKIQAVELRNRTINSYKRLIEDVFRKIMRREEADIIRQLRKSNDMELFSLWLSDFYRDHEEYMNKQLLPVLNTLGEAIFAQVLLEVATEMEITPEFNTFVIGYLGLMIYRHVGTSINRIRTTLDAAIKEGNDVVDAIQNEFDSWQEKRIEGIVSEETTRFSNAITRFTYGMAGVKRVQWVADDDPCPFCQYLDGQIVDINSNFVEKDQELEVNGVKFKSSRSISHGPLHSGCECKIEAVL
jgi:HK97 family phage portal protein